jgi:hypothetical protein
VSRRAESSATEKVPVSKATVPSCRCPVRGVPPGAEGEADIGPLRLRDDAHCGGEEDRVFLAEVGGQQVREGAGRLVEPVGELLEGALVGLVDEGRKLLLEPSNIVVFSPHHPGGAGYPVSLDDRKQDVLLPHVVALRFHEVLREVVQLLPVGGGEPLIPRARQGPRDLDEALGIAEHQLVLPHEDLYRVPLGGDSIVPLVPVPPAGVNVGHRVLLS